MKVSELVIGAWVSYKHPEGIRITKVGEIYPKGIITHDGCSLLEDEIEPISITPDILEKNGFKGETYATLALDENKSLEYYYHENRLIMRYEGIDEWDNHAPVSDVLFRCQCFYVHQLQHALKLCGINKEIEL